MNWNVAIDGALLPDHPANLAKFRPKYPVLMGDMLEDFALFSEFYSRLFPLILSEILQFLE